MAQAGNEAALSASAHRINLSLIFIPASPAS
jgi:hypothetical protein